MSDEKNYSLGIFIALVSGLAAGAVIGMLFAPKSGKELRKEIKETSEELIEKGKKNVGEIVDKAKDITDKSKEKIAELKTKGEEFISQVKETAKEVEDNLS